jgi:hypothetical protein
MSGMLPNQDYSRMVTQDREREMREHVSRRSHAAARSVAPDRGGEPAGPRLRPLRLRLVRHVHLFHHGPALRTVTVIAVVTATLLLFSGLIPMS